MKRPFLMTFILCSLVITSLVMATDWFLSPAFAQPDPTSPDPDRSSGKNKDASGATQIRLGGADENGSISYDEGDRTDWYKVQVEHDGRLIFTLQNKIEDDLNLEVYGPDTTTKLAESLTPGTGNEEVSFRVQANTWYYAKVYAHQSGDAGNYVISNTFYEEDLTPPQVILPQSKWETTEDTVIIPGTVKDNDAIAAIRIDGIEILSSTTLLSPSSGEARAFLYPVKDLAYGETLVGIEAEDAAGNLAPPVKVTIMRHDPTPDITITAPEDGAWVNEGQVMIRGTVLDNTQVDRLLINDVDISDQIPSIGERQVRFEYMLKEIPYGKSKITVRAEDDQGLSPHVTVSVYRDAPPTISIERPLDGVRIQEEMIQVQGVIADDRHITQVRVNGVRVSNVQDVEWAGTGQKQAFTYTVPRLQYGENVLTIEAEDDSGNVSPEEIRVYRKEIPPKIFIHAPRDHDTIAADQVLIEGTVSDADDVNVVKINEEPVAFDASGAFSHQVTSLPFGPYEIAVTAVDTRGEEAHASIHITRVDPNAPVIEIVDPADGKRINDTEIPITVHIKDDDRITHITLNGKEMDSETKPPTSEISFNEVITGLKNGENLIQVTARDASRNTATKSIRIYKIPPPTIVMSRPKSDTHTVAETILLEGQIRTEDKVVSLHINEIEVPVNRDQQNSFSYQVPQLRLGKNLVKMTATDALGGKTDETLTITRLDPDYQSGEDKTAEGAHHLSVNESMKEVDINYDGDRTDWFKIPLETTGELTVKVNNALPGDLNVEVYGPDTTTKIGESTTPDTGDETLTVRTDQEGAFYYVKVTAVGLGDRGRYTISAHFVEVDTLPPEIRILQPKQKQVWIEPGKELTVAGTVQDNAAIKTVQIVGDQIQPLGGTSIKGDGTLGFAYVIRGLQLGQNVLKIIATDQAGNRCEEERLVSVGEEQLPVIRLTSVTPSKKVQKDHVGNISYAETESELLTLQGTVTSAKGLDTVTFSVGENGRKGTKPEKSAMQFREDISLKLGSNEITIEATDTLRQSATHLLTAMRRKKLEIHDLAQFLEHLRTGNLYAVVIGIGMYQDDRLNLRYAADDAQGFYDVLVDPNYGRIPREHVQLLLDQEATYPRIKYAIGKWLPQQATADDMVLIYYSGHGALEGDEAYWVTHQADIDNLYSTAFSNTEIVDMLDRIPSNRRVVFLDCCYSAAITHQKNRTKSLGIESKFEALLKKFSGKGQVTISSSDGTQVSLELEDYGHGVFTYYLLEGLRGEADKDPDGVIDVDEIWDYVKYQVIEAARKAGKPQTPTRQGKSTAGIPLTFNVSLLQEKLLQVKKDLIIDLFQQGELSPDQLEKAFAILKSGQEDRVLESFFAGEISLELFKEIFR